MRYLLLTYLTLFSTITFGQTKNEITIKEKILHFDKNDSIKEALEIYNEKIEKENEVYAEVMVEVKPEFNDGKEGFRKYILDRFITPKDPSFIGGSIPFSMIIEKDGGLSDIKVNERDLGFGVGKQVEEILKKSPKWIPAQTEGRIVRCRYFYFVKINGNK